jgi:hypothetical protein
LWLEEEEDNIKMPVHSWSIEDLLIQDTWNFFFFAKHSDCTKFANYEYTKSSLVLSSEAESGAEPVVPTAAVAVCAPRTLP